jgi:hypothetical protein
MEIEFEDPPEEALLRQRASGAKYLEFAIALREHPEKWAVLPSDPPPASDKAGQNAAQNIRRGVTKAFAPKGAYEAVYAPETGKIHVRYMPNGAEAEGDEKDPPKPAAAKSSRAAVGDPHAEDEATVARKAFAPRVRAWAKEKGIEVSEHGRLPEDIIQHYLADTGEERPPHLRAVR